MKLPNIQQYMRKVGDKNIRDTLSRMWTTLSRSVNGRLEYGSPQAAQAALPQTGNIDGTWPGAFTAVNGYSITTPATANQEFTVTHNLGRIPTGYDVKGQDQAGIIYDSRKPLWTTTQMFLKCSVVSMNCNLFVH